MIGTTEIVIIAVIVFVLFGASAIPKIAKSIGLAKKEFEKGIKEDNNSKTEVKDNNQINDKS